MPAGACAGATSPRTRPPLREPPGRAKTETAAVAIGKALPLLVQAVAGHAVQKTRLACYNQAIPTMSFAAAKARGIVLLASVFSGNP